MGLAAPAWLHTRRPPERTLLRRVFRMSDCVGGMRSRNRWVVTRMSLMIACERKGSAMARFLRGSTLALYVIALATTGTTALAQDATSTGSTPACVDVATPDVDTVMAEAY